MDWNKSITVQGEVPGIPFEKHHSDDPPGSMGATGIFTLYKNELIDIEILALNDYILNSPPIFKLKCIDAKLIKKAYDQWWRKTFDDAFFQLMIKDNNK